MCHNGHGNRQLWTNYVVVIVIVIVTYPLSSTVLEISRLVCIYQYPTALPGRTVKRRLGVGGPALVNAVIMVNIGQTAVTIGLLGNQG